MNDLNSYFDTMFENIDKNIKLDKNQLNIVIDENRYCLVIAGAGAGKTTTMSAKVKYLCDIKKVHPSKILMISYTNKAVEELKERINKDFKLPVKIATFHSLALEIVKKYSDKLTIIEDSTSIIKRIVYNADISLKTLITKYILDYNYECLDNITFTSKEEYLKYKKDIKYQNIKGEYFDNNIEVVISNYLLLNRIIYLYKKDITISNNIYTPTFTIITKNVKLYVNVMCLDKQYFYLKNLKKLNTISKKYHQEFKNNYFEITDNENFLIEFVDKMSKYDITMQIKSELFYNELTLKYKSIINKTIVLITNYFKLLQTKAIPITSLLENNPTKREATFLKTLSLVEEEYTLYLQNNSLIDFETMILKANQILTENKDISLEYNYIIIDEYQDIAKQRFDMIYKLSNILNTNLTVVGDDWQSIFSFAGSNVDLFMKFKEIFTPSVEHKIVNTYRNSQRLIDIAGTFVQENKSQIRKTLISPKKTKYPIIIRVYEKDKNKVLVEVIEEIVKSYTTSKSILIIFRFNFELNYLLKNNNFILKEKRLIYKQYPSLNLSYMSAHSSKGLGFDNVIIYNADNSMHGFPAQIIDDSLYSLINKEETMPYAEERRLFYVALTRTKNTTYIITSKTNPSPFVLEISKYKHIKIDKELNKYQIKHKCPMCGYYIVIDKNTPIKEKTIYKCSNHYLVCSFKTTSLYKKEPLKRCKKCKEGYMISYDVKKPYLLTCSNSCFSGEKYINEN